MIENIIPRESLEHSQSNSSKRKANEVSDQSLPNKKKRKQKFGRTTNSPQKEIKRGLYIDPGTPKEIQEALKKIIASDYPNISLVIYNDKKNIYQTADGTDMKRLTTLIPGFTICQQRISNLDKTPVRAVKSKISSSSVSILKSLIEPPANNKKTISFSFNKSKLQQIKKQFDKQGKRRLTSQSTAVTKIDGEIREIKASEAAQAYGFPLKDENNDLIRYEWLHLGAYRFLGEEGQDHKNLVLGTRHCNTLMMFVEDEIAKLANEINDNNNSDENESTDEHFVKVLVEANLMPNTHMATLITYKIQCSALGIDIVFNFDPLTCYHPQNNLEDNVSLIFKLAKETKQPIGYKDFSQTKSLSQDLSSENCNNQAIEKMEGLAFNSLFFNKSDSNKKINLKLDDLFTEDELSECLSTDSTNAKPLELTK